MNTTIGTRSMCGSFRTGHGFAAKSFNTWVCWWMPIPEAPEDSSAD